MEEEQSKVTTVEQGYYSYPNEDAALLAVKEIERIERLEKQIDYQKPQVVYSLYCKVIDKGIFHTPEGFLYLVHLRKYLEEHQNEIDKAIPGIPAGLLPVLEVDEKRMVQRSNRVTPKVEETTPKEKMMIYRIIIAFLICMVVGMLIIANLSNSPSILNYEKEIQNKYADWEQQLEEKEAELKEREQALEEEP